MQWLYKTMAMKNKIKNSDMDLQKYSLLLKKKKDTQEICIRSFNFSFSSMNTTRW